MSHSPDQSQSLYTNGEKRQVAYIHAKTVGWADYVQVYEDSRKKYNSSSSLDDNI